VLARRALNGQQRRFPARADHADAFATSVENWKHLPAEEKEKWNGLGAVAKAQYERKAAASSARAGAASGKRRAPPKQAAKAGKAGKGTHRREEAYGCGAVCSRGGGGGAGAAQAPRDDEGRARSTAARGGAPDCRCASTAHILVASIRRLPIVGVLLPRHELIRQVSEVVHATCSFISIQALCTHIGLVV
jgi:hypothetical protein